MGIDEKILAKEQRVREMLEELRKNLNAQRLVHNKNKTDWKYFTSLSHTELKLKEVLEFFQIKN
jgi:hypothetical protein